MNNDTTNNEQTDADNCTMNNDIHEQTYADDNNMNNMDFESTQCEQSHHDQLSNIEDHYLNPDIDHTWLNFQRKLHDAYTNVTLKISNFSNTKMKPSEIYLI